MTTTARRGKLGPLILGSVVLLATAAWTFFLGWAVYATAVWVSSATGVPT